MRRISVAVVAVGAALALMSAVPSAQSPFTSRVVAQGLEGPWEVVWGPDGRLWVTERLARRVVRIDPATGAVNTLVTIDDSYDPGRTWHEGLLGLALHPDLLKNLGADYVYVAYTYDADPGAEMTRRLKVRRYTFDRMSLTLREPVDVISNLPAGTDHAGGRMSIGQDRKLYLTRGDHGANWLSNWCLASPAQELPTAAQVSAKDWSTYGGKILRINLDGSIPSDNPVISGVRSHVFSYGHRNPQGLQFGPAGQIYSSEHGPGTDDELNLIVPGGNYGWPYIAGYRDDRSYVFTQWSAAPECRSLKFDEFSAPPSVPRQKESAWTGTFNPPMRTFFTVPENYDLQKQGSGTIAAGGFEVYTSSAIPGWANSILQTGMTRGRVYRVKLSADGKMAVGENEELFISANRYRDIAIGPDGKTFYLATDNNGFGSTVDPSGATVRTFANPGAVVEYRR